jgi:GNAT superfamily N-acetyltransferase
MLDSPEHPPGFSMRAVVRADLEALQQQIREIRRLDDDPTASPEQVAALLAAPGLDLARDTRAVVDHSGTPVGATFFIRGQDTRDEAVWLAPGAVHPAFRRRGLGRLLMAWVTRRADEAWRDEAAGHPGCLRIDCRDTLTDRRALYARFGFAPIRHFCHLVLDLPAVPCEPAVPEGIVLTPWREAIDAQVMAASAEIFAAHWASSAVTPASWRQQVTANRRFRGELSSIAWCGSRIVGLCLAVIEPASDAGQPDAAWLMQLGVRPDARRHGLATTLMQSVQERFRAAGFSRVWASVDTENPTEIRTLCLKLGYTPAARYIRFSRDLAAGQ